MKKTISIIIIAVLVVAGSLYLFMASSKTKTTINPSATQQGGIDQQNNIVERGGLYYVGAKTLGTGYIHENGRIFYVERIQYYTGTSSPDGLRYNKFVVANANPATFSLMTDVAIQNNESVYYQWGKDDKNVFYQGLVARPSASSTPPIDMRTFTVIPNNSFSFGKDRSAVYEFSPGTYRELANVDHATFVFVGDTCAKDKNSFYTIGYYGEFAATTSTSLTPAQCVHLGPGF